MVWHKVAVSLQRKNELVFTGDFHNFVDAALQDART